METEIKPIDVAKYERLAKRIAEIDPDRITPETVKRLLGWCPRWSARAILNTGVRRGQFKKVADDVYTFIGSETR